MNKGLRTKGLEEEVYGGKPDGTVVGLSHRVVADMPDFHTEPDCRNIEFTTPPIRSYSELGCRVMTTRKRLRDWLEQAGGYTLLPGSALSLGDSSVFERSNPEHPYHDWIENTYHTDVVTTSAHLNVGVSDPDEILRAWRVLRLDACLFLGLTACSPFLDNTLTGSHSHRWRIFPKTPKNVPFFRTQPQFAAWMQEQIDAGIMHNPRHLWLSIRPNGTKTPHAFERLELRICDRIDDPDVLLAITALYECMIHQIITSGIDVNESPLFVGDETEAQLGALADANEDAVATTSLEAQITDWQTGEKTTANALLRKRLAGLEDIAAELGISEWLTPISRILDEGSPATRWLARHAAGESIRDIIASEAQEMPRMEARFQQRLGCLS